MEDDTEAGGAGMNSGGGIHGLDGQIEIVSVFLVNQLDDLDDEFRSIGMDDEDLMILDVISELVHIIHDLFKGRKTAEHFSDGIHSSLVIDGDDRLDGKDCSHGRRKAGQTAGSLEEFEVVDESEKGIVFYEIVFGNIEDLFQALSFLVKLSDLFEYDKGQSGDSLCVEGVDRSFGIFFFENLDGDVHGVEGAGELAGEMDIEDVVAFLEFGLEVGNIFLGRKTGCLGNVAIAKPVIESVGVERLFGFVGEDFFAVDSVGHRNQPISVFLRDFRANVAVRIGKQSQILSSHVLSSFNERHFISSILKQYLFKKRTNVSKGRKWNTKKKECINNLPIRWIVILYTSAEKGGGLLKVYVLHLILQQSVSYEKRIDAERHDGEEIPFDIVGKENRPASVKDQSPTIENGP